MNLYLVRHGRAAEGAPDSARPLTPRGRAAVERMAAHLARSGVRVLEIRHSRRLRAAQTAAVLADAIGPRTPPREVGGLDPMDDVEDVARDLAIEELPLMLVGHMPFLGRLTSRLLAGSRDRAPVAFPTAGVACLRRERDLWVLEWHLGPGQVGRSD